MSKMRFFALQELANRRPLEVITPSNKLSDYYGSHVFDRKKMQEYLPKEAYKAVTDAIEKGTPINREMADLIANGMKSWAKSLNVTHYTHWFQPLTDGTAEKHDGFIEFGEDGDVIERFSGKLLIQQEPDASSFPNGGIRNTFEARGYTAWDVSSPAFVVDTTLCIPTIFISYTGEALDYKTPLLKALAAVDKAATDVCQLFDKNIARVYTNLGWEQEYFLVDLALYNARPDLCLTGRTLMGHSSAKDQQLEDHYFGSIPPRVTAFMKELEIECHKLGIPVKTRHNEVAPNQFELAPIFENANLANDHNQLVMDLMKRIARKHNFAVLLHEKPYSGVNGSGKHNNWSLCTDTGINLFAPGKNPKGNMLFLTFLVNVLMMVYKNQDLLRASIASAGNSYRLGANEAPPAILSIFLGKQLSSILDEIARQVSNSKMTAEEKTTLKLGIGRIPEILLDTTDRNRTSPFAFTGNRFEFRAVGSIANCASALIALNTAVAEALTDFHARVEALIAKGESKVSAILDVLREDIKTCKPIHFDGNGYSDEWKAEAARRAAENAVAAAEAAVQALQDQQAPETGAADLDALRTRLTALQTARQQAAEQEKALTAQLVPNRRAAADYRRLAAARQVLETRWQWVNALASTAGGTLSSKQKIKLEAYIQMHYLDRILVHANTRLMQMTAGQYELERVGAENQRSQSGLDLGVIDHYNGTRRSVKTLSGGESFKASLALALGLSDEVQSAAGGIRLDTLFLDEGFGSLDDESLEQAIRVLAGLTEGDRLVGIISHVAALKERIDKQVVVKKARSGGSTVEVIV